MEETIALDGKVKLMPYGTNYAGKHDGWAYQFLNDNYEGIHLGVCCKDFLQDIVWSELTKKSMSIYNQDSSYLGILDKQELLKICIYPYLLNGIALPVIDNINELAENLQGFLNEIEVLKGYDLSVVYSLDNKIIIEFSKEWISKPLIFSLFTLLCRFGIYYDGKLTEYFEKVFSRNDVPYLDKNDLYTIQNNLNYVYIFLDNKCIISQKDWVELLGPSDVHGSGFFSNLKQVKYDFK